MAFENLKSTGIAYLLSKLKTWTETTFAKISDAVFSVNSVFPDDNGDVVIERVNMAGNLETSFNQNSAGTFIQRTTGGNAAIIDGRSHLISVMGNIVHENHVDAIVDMVVTPVSEDDPISATINKEAFIDSLDDRDQSIVIALTYSSSTGWSDDPAEMGITIIGTETDGDAIVINYTPEVRGTILLTTPSKFASTGWNLYDPANEYAKVVKYSDDYGYMISGAYSALYFATTPSGVTTPITPAQNGTFSVPGNGYVMVTGGNPSSTAIFPTWSDWTTGYPGSFEEFSVSEIDFSSLVGDGKFFSYGLCAVGSVRDEISLSTGKAYRRIERLEYNETNLNSAKSSGRPYIYDTDYIYLVLGSAAYTTISMSSVFTANDHGIEYFMDTDIPAYAQASYNMNLKNKLERDTLTISQQTLSSNEQAQVRSNIGAPSSADITNAVATLNGSIIVKTYTFKTTAAINANAQKSFTAENFAVQVLEGYKIVHVNCRSTGHQYLHCYAVYPVSTGTIISLRNNYTSNVSSGRTISIDVMYVRSQLVGG